MNLKDKLLGFHHCPWALAVATRKSASNFKTRNKAALDTWEHVDYGVGQCPTWAMSNLGYEAIALSLGGYSSEQAPRLKF